MRARRLLLAWSPPAILALGALASVGVDVQQTVPLRAPLQQAVPAALAGFVAKDLALPDAERRAVRVSDYLLRSYSVGTGAEAFSLYVGYYDRQTGAKTIHSPRNCLPGAGWEALASRPVEVQTPRGPIRVNEYLIQRGKTRALVYYWYQGRGRVESSEYAVKWDLLRDAAVRRRTEEALVRIVIPITGPENESVELGSRVASLVIPRIFEALPS